MSSSGTLPHSILLLRNLGIDFTEGCLLVKFHMSPLLQVAIFPGSCLTPQTNFQMAPLCKIQSMANSQGVMRLSNKESLKRGTSVLYCFSYTCYSWSSGHTWEEMVLILHIGWASRRQLMGPSICK